MLIWQSLAHWGRLSDDGAEGHWHTDERLRAKVNLHGAERGVLDTGSGWEL